jgi:hypothetical protein
MTSIKERLSVRSDLFIWGVLIFKNKTSDAKLGIISGVPCLELVDDDKLVFQPFDISELLN